MDVPARYWMIGITAAVLAHGAIAAAMFWQEPHAGARSAGMGGVEVSLGPSGGAPGTVSAATTEPTEAVDPVETRVQPIEEQATEPQPDSVTARPVEAAPGDAPVQVTEAEPVETERETESQEQPAERDPEVAEALPEPEEPETSVTAQPVRQTATVEQPGPEETAAEDTEEVAPEAAETTSPPEEAPQETDQEEVKMTDAAPSSAGAQGKSGTRDGQRAGSDESATAGGVPGASADYMTALRAWLEKHKRYPRRARRLRQEGTALLYFVMDREGRVLEYTIRESSGHKILDDEVEEMIERAQPLPGMPEDMEQNRLELIVPVQFFLM